MIALRRRHVPHGLRTGLAVALALLVWQAAAEALAGRYLLAGPWEIAGHIATHPGLLWRALVATGSAAAQGWLWGNLAAVGLAALALLLPVLERPIRLVGLVVFCLPLVALGPILRVLCGPGDAPQVWLAALGVFFTTLVPLLVGLRAVPRVWLDMVESYGRGRWAQLAHVRARAALPYLVMGLQIAAPAAFLAAMIGEFTGAERGLGVLTLRALRSLDVTATWTLAVIATLVAMAAHGAIGAAARALHVTAPPLILSPPVTARRSWVPTVLTLLAVLVLWQEAMDAFGLSRFFAKRPGDVWAYLVSGPQAGEHRATLATAMGQTLATAIPGYLAGLACGLGLAVTSVLLPGLGRAILPMAILLRAAPIVTTAPLIVFVLGRGPLGTLGIVAVMIFFPAFIACLYGLRQVPLRILDLGRCYEAGRLTVLWHMRIPAMLPAFFGAARMVVPAAVLAATVSEWLATGTGTGNLMALSASLSDYGMLWSCVVALTAVSVALHGLMSMVERRVLARVAPEQLS